MLDDLVGQRNNHSSRNQLKLTQTDIETGGAFQTKSDAYHFQFTGTIIKGSNAFRIEKRYIIIDNINTVRIYMLRMNYRRNTYLRNTLNIHTFSFYLRQRYQ